MKVWINGEVHDCDKEMVVIIFDNDNERIIHGSNIKNNFVPKKGPRLYAVFPNGTEGVTETCLEILKCL